MEKVRWNDAWPRGERPLVITLGFFDGLHLGHRELMQRTRLLADQIGAQSALMSFEPHPSHVIAGKEPVPLIYGPAEKEWILRENGSMDRVFMMEFDRELMEMEPERFVEAVLKKNAGAAGIVIGDNFRFGRGNRGDAALMSRLCERLDMRCEIVAEVDDLGRRVSSSRIRELFARGEIEQANRLLGRPYLMLGCVSRGSGLGHKELYPTINLLLPCGRQYPARGVYVTRTFTGDGRAYESVSNIGNNPTVREGISLRCETHLLDFERELYGEAVRVEFYRRLRPERRFDSIQELREQLRQDIQSARVYFAGEKGNEE